jgi:hypothetical protein
VFSSASRFVLNIKNGSSVIKDINSLSKSKKTLERKIGKVEEAAVAYTKEGHHYNV